MKRGRPKPKARKERAPAPMSSFLRKFFIATLLAFLVFPLTLSRSSAGTGNAMNTATLLTRLSNALGGMGNIEKIHSLYFSWEFKTLAFESGEVTMPTTLLHEWVTSGGNQRVEQRSSAGQTEPILTVFSTSSGSPEGWMLVGDQGWPSGNSTGAMQGPDLERQISSAYWASFAYLTSGGLPGKVSYKAVRGASYYLLKMDPNGGVPIRAYLNPKTFLPDKVEFGGDAWKTVEVLSDWKVFHGVRFPYAMTVRMFERGTWRGQGFYTLKQVRMNLTLSADLFKQPTPAL